MSKRRFENRPGSRWVHPDEVTGDDNKYGEMDDSDDEYLSQEYLPHIPVAPLPYPSRGSIYSVGDDGKKFIDLNGAEPLIKKCKFCSKDIPCDFMQCTDDLDPYCYVPRTKVMDERNLPDVVAVREGVRVLEPELKGLSFNLRNQLTSVGGPDLSHGDLMRLHRMVSQRKWYCYPHYNKKDADWIERQLRLARVLRTSVNRNRLAAMARREAQRKLRSRYRGRRVPEMVQRSLCPVRSCYHGSSLPHYVGGSRRTPIHNRPPLSFSYVSRRDRYKRFNRGFGLTKAQRIAVNRNRALALRLKHVRRRGLNVGVNRRVLMNRLNKRSAVNRSLRKKYRYRRKFKYGGGPMDYFVFDR